KKPARAGFFGETGDGRRETRNTGMKDPATISPVSRLPSLASRLSLSQLARVTDAADVFDVGVTHFLQGCLCNSGAIAAAAEELDRRVLGQVQLADLLANLRVGNEGAVVHVIGLVLGQAAH